MVSPGWGGFAGEPPAHVIGHRPEDHGGTFREGLVIWGKPAVQHQPAERALDRPPAGSGAKPFWPSGLGTTSKVMPHLAAWARRPALYPARTFGQAAASELATFLPPLVSYTDAAVTTTASSRPRVSVAMCRLRALS